MPKKRRLRRADFSSIATSASKRYLGVYFSLSAARLPVLAKDTGPKCACVVSKKAAAHAVDRNIIKRRCREATRRATDGLTLPYSLVFYAKKEAKGISYAEIENDVRKLLAQIK